MELRIDPEFEGKIPPLTAEEFQQLENNILADGVVINPIIVWDGVIVDGHNRYRIVSKHPEIQFSTCEKTFADRYEAIAWICKNQLGRRNLTKEQKKYLIGKQYEAEKASHGGDRGNQYTNLASCQIGNLPKERKTCERIAEENGISSRSVCRAEAFSKAVDIADAVEPGIRDEILAGKIKPTEKDVHALARADPEERPAIIEEMRKSPEEKRKAAPLAKLLDKSLTQVEQISEDMLTSRRKGTQADMLYELEDALDSLMFRWSMCLNNNQDFFADDECQPKIHKLVQTGLDYLHQILKGEIPK
ncbi:hypothetical protein ACTNEA_00115 [Oscillospiraceae bacterium HCP3S3_F4]